MYCEIDIYRTKKRTYNVLSYKLLDINKRNYIQKLISLLSEKGYSHMKMPNLEGSVTHCGWATHRPNTFILFLTDLDGLYLTGCAFDMNM